MGFFGLKSKKEVEEEKHEAARQAAIDAKEEVIRNNYMSLSNLSKGSQVNFVVPYFDVFDLRFMASFAAVNVAKTIRRHFAPELSIGKLKSLMVNAYYPATNYLRIRETTEHDIKYQTFQRTI